MSTHAPYNQLSDGTRWHFEQPPTELDIGVVARALSQIARWGGQGKLLDDDCVYTVAQHSVKASYIDETLTTLMHDAHEIILGDLCSPMKQYLRERTNALKALDVITAKAFAGIFKTEYPMPEATHKADVLIGLIESFDLMPDNGKDLWWCVGGLDDLEEARELYISTPGLRPEAWTPEESCDNFMERYWELDPNAEH